MCIVSIFRTGTPPPSLSLSLSLSLCTMRSCMKIKEEERNLAVLIGDKYK